MRCRFISPEGVGSLHYEAEVFLKASPTVIPIIVPMITPATKSENQWIVIETPTPTYSAYSSAAPRATLLPEYSVHIAAAIANATVVCEDGQP